MTVQWHEITAACKGAKYRLRKKNKRNIKRSRGGLFIEPAAELTAMNTALTCSGHDAYTNPSDPPDDDPVPGVYGPYRTKGMKYWLQVEETTLDFYIWWDVDPDDDPDIRMLLDTFLADETYEEYHKGVERKAKSLGY